MLYKEILYTLKKLKKKGRFWESFSNLSKKWFQIKELKKVLLSVGTMSHVAKCSGYTSAWQLVTSEPFKKLDRQPSSSQIEDCCRSLRLLQACPIVDKLNFSKMIQYCLKSDQIHFAAAFSPFLNDEDRKQIAKVFRNWTLLICSVIYFNNAAIRCNCYWIL